MKKIIIFILLLLGVALTAQAVETTNLETDPVLIKARVTKIVSQDKVTRLGSYDQIRQIIHLVGLEGDWKDKEIIPKDPEYDQPGQQFYKVGDRVLVSYQKNSDGEDTFYVVDYYRVPALYWLAIIFALVVIAIAYWQGLRSLLGLLITFVIIIFGIIPRILDGNDPVLVVTIGSLLILAITFYLIHGWHKVTHVSLLGTVIALGITVGLSFLFTYFTKLTGFAAEEANYLLNIANRTLDVKGILLASMVLGALGVLDDVTVSQASLVDQLRQAKPNISPLELFKRGMVVGRDHLGSIVNTLILAYAGASLPLFILYTAPNAIGKYLPFDWVINQEIIATEIVRMLVGSIGIALAVPLTSFIAVWFGKSIKAADRVN